MRFLVRRLRREIREGHRGRGPWLGVEAALCRSAFVIRVNVALESPRRSRIAAGATPWARRRRTCASNSGVMVSRPNLGSFCAIALAPPLGAPKALEEGLKHLVALGERGVHTGACGFAKRRVFAERRDSREALFRRKGEAALRFLRFDPQRRQTG